VQRIAAVRAADPPRLLVAERFLRGRRGEHADARRQRSHPSCVRPLAKACQGARRLARAAPRQAAAAPAEARPKTCVSVSNRETEQGKELAPLRPALLFWRSGWKRNGSRRRRRIHRIDRCHVERVRALVQHQFQTAHVTAIVLSLARTIVTIQHCPLDLCVAGWATPRHRSPPCGRDNA
jgi:hypothetical protein